VIGFFSINAALLDKDEQEDVSCSNLRKCAPVVLTMLSSGADTICSFVAYGDNQNINIRYASAAFSLSSALFRSCIPDGYLIDTLSSIKGTQKAHIETIEDAIDKKKSDELREEVVTLLKTHNKSLYDKIKDQLALLSTRTVLWGLASANVGLALFEAYSPYQNVRDGMELGSGIISFLMLVGTMKACCDLGLCCK